MPDAIIPLGDNQYENGTLEKYQESYALSWGRDELMLKSHPVPGNHEYQTPGAAGYFDYFGARAGDRTTGGYYSFELGNWHLIALNTNCRKIPRGVAANGCAQKSPQNVWLEEDLAANTKPCILAYFHHARWSSGADHGGSTAGKPFIQDLYRHNADVLLTGHDHVYERFAQQTPGGAPDAVRGIRQFVVGTGGRGLDALGTRKANSEVFNNESFGVLKLTLQAAGYAWEFVPDETSTFADTGATACH